jgi:hypothetical protein
MYWALTIGSSHYQRLVCHVLISHNWILTLPATTVVCHVLSAHNWIFPLPTTSLSCTERSQLDPNITSTKSVMLLALTIGFSHCQHLVCHVLRAHHWILTLPAPSLTCYGRSQLDAHIASTKSVMYWVLTIGSSHCQHQVCHVLRAHNWILTLPTTSLTCTESSETDPHIASTKSVMLWALTIGS